MIVGRKKPLAILLIEDNRADAFLTKEILNDSIVPNTIRVMQDAAQAFIQMLVRDGGAGMHLPDIILLDLNLPLMDGFAFLGEMAKEGGLQDIPVFVLSSSSAPADIERARTLGARGYFVKPLDLDHFDAEIRMLFEAA